MLLLHVLLPVPPPLDEVAVVAAFTDHVPCDRQEDRRFTARIRSEPVIGVRRGIREAYVEHDELRAALLALHDALRMRVEIVARFEMRADQQNDFGIGVIRTRTVISHPELIARARA